MAYGDEWDSNKMLALYVHDYMKKKNMHEVGELFAREANLNLIPLIESSEGFLAEWWTVFWPTYISKNLNDSAVMPESSGMATMMENVEVLTSGMNHQGAGTSQETMMGNTQQDIFPVVPTTGMNQQWAGDFPISTDFGNMLGQPAASLLPTLGMSQQMDGNFSINTNFGNMLGQPAASLVPTPGINQHRAGNFGPRYGDVLNADNRHHTMPSSSNASHLQMPASMQSPLQVARDYRNDIALGRSIQMEPTLLAGPNSIYPTTGLHDAGKDKRKSQMPMREGALNGVDPVSSGMGNRVPDSLLLIQQQPRQIFGASRQHDISSHSHLMMSAPRRETVERQRMAHIKKTARNQQKGQLQHQLSENSGKGMTSSNLLAVRTDLVETNADGDIPIYENVDSLLSTDDENVDDMSNPFSALQRSSSASNSNELKGFSFDEVGSFNTSKDKVLCCHFSSEGRYLACAGHERKIMVWNMDTYDFVNDWEGHSHIITDVRFKPNSAIFATSSFDRTVQIWDGKRPYESLMKLEGHAEPVMSVDFHPVKMDMLCSCDRSGEIRIWNVDKNACTCVSKGASRQLRFQPETGNLLAAAAGNVLNLIDVETHRHFFRLEGHVKDILAVCWDNSGKYIASVSEDSARVWSTDSGGKCIHVLPSSGNKFQSCIFHPGYSQLLVIGSYEMLEMWNPTRSNKTVSVKAHDGIISGLAASPWNKVIASVSHDRWMKIWK